MTTIEQSKCAHVPCQCAVPAGDTYCGQACKDAGAAEVEIACLCGHDSCPLTA